MPDGAIDRRRAEVKLRNLAGVLRDKPLPGTVGNAHPHAKARVVIVHNGIVENLYALSDEVEECGHRFESKTESKIMGNLLS